MQDTFTILAISQVLAALVIDFIHWCLVWLLRASTRLKNVTTNSDAQCPKLLAIKIYETGRAPAVQTMWDVKLAGYGDVVFWKEPYSGVRIPMIRIGSKVSKNYNNDTRNSLDMDLYFFPWSDPEKTLEPYRTVTTQENMKGYQLKKRNLAVLNPFYGIEPSYPYMVNAITFTPTQISIAQKIVARYIKLGEKGMLTNCSVVLCGPWGSGKSVIVDIIAKLLLDLGYEPLILKVSLTTPGCELREVLNMTDITTESKKVRIVALNEIDSAIESAIREQNKVREILTPSENEGTLKDFIDDISNSPFVITIATTNIAKSRLEDRDVNPNYWQFVRSGRF